MAKDNIEEVEIYGIKTPVRILKHHLFGTMDVERLSDGNCYRVSGLQNVPDACIRVGKEQE